MVEQSKDPLLQPLSIRHVVFRNRFVSTSHASGLEEGRSSQLADECDGNLTTLFAS